MSKNPVLMCFQVLALMICKSAGSLAQAPVDLAVAGSTALPPRPGRQLVSVWSGGAYLMIDDSPSAAPVFTAIDRNGKQALRYVFTIPGANHIDVINGRFARGFDGSLALAGSAFTDDSRGSQFVAWVSPDGQRQTVIRTPGFSPFGVALASDGTIWVAGMEVQNAKEVNPNHNMIRRYDRAGKLLAAFVPRSSLAIDTDVFDPKWHPGLRSSLVASRDRVGWYSILARTYMEFSLDGQVISHVETIRHDQYTMQGLALCDDGGVFVSTQSNASTGWKISALDRTRGVWTSIPRNERWGLLLGCDGASLAITTNGSSITWLEPRAPNTRN